MTGKRRIEDLRFEGADEPDLPGLEDEHGVPLPGMETPWTPEVKAALETVGKIMQKRHALVEEVAELTEKMAAFGLQLKGCQAEDAVLKAHEAQAREALDVALARQWALE